jgi:type IV pilus assembly protein PilN
MIRINLLPVRAAKKKESIRFQLTVAALVTFLVFAVSMVAYLVVMSEASGLKDQISSGQQELDQLEENRRAFQDKGTEEGGRGEAQDHRRA